jgi:hypothetical protein
MSHRAPFPLLIPLLLPFAFGCGGSKPAEEAAPAETVAEAPSDPPIADADAKATVERFVSAMNSKDNLQLVRMVKPGGKFIMATPQGNRVMDSNEFLAFFQDGLRAVGMSYGVEIKNMEVRPKVGGAIVRAEIVETWARQKFESNNNFHLEDVDGSIKIVGMDGAK